jgi:hypothetical protein
MGAGELSRLGDHRANGQIVRTRAGFGPVPVDEQELINSVGGCGEQIAPEAEQVAVPCVEARDRPSSHQSDLVGNRDARHGGTTEVIVRDQERRRDAAHHADLMPDVHEVGLGRRLHLADDMEVALRVHETRIRREARRVLFCSSRYRAGLSRTLQRRHGSSTQGRSGRSTPADTGPMCGEAS